MQSHYNKLIVLVLFVTFIKEIVFSFVVPVWQTPDEQAHFSQVAYLAEVGRMPGSGNDLNKEVYNSERLLGTLRDKNGNNKFTFHPEYKIDYTNGLIGRYETEINNYPVGYRGDFIKQEAANYPTFYYWLSAVLYKLFYTHGLIDRIYAVRMVSVLMSIGTVLVAWLIGKEVKI